MKRFSVTNLLIFIIGTELVGVLSGILAGGNFSALYGILERPPLSPPGFIFPILWAILYALMGFSAYLIYNTDDTERIKSLWIYAAQLFFNFLWSIVFFRFEAFQGALLILIALAVLVIWMILRFYKIRKTAALVNLPYLLWILYALYLNIGIVVLNG